MELSKEQMARIRQFANDVRGEVDGCGLASQDHNICCSHEEWLKLCDALIAALRSIEQEGWVRVPKEPEPGRLMSMAIRADHALGCPGYYDQPFIHKFNGVTHAQMVESTVATMRQLYEEATGQGFYKPEREEEYKAQLPAAPK